MHTRASLLAGFQRAGYRRARPRSAVFDDIRFPRTAVPDCGVDAGRPVDRPVTAPRSSTDATFWLVASPGYRAVDRVLGFAERPQPQHAPTPTSRGAFERMPVTRRVGRRLGRRFRIRGGSGWRPRPPPFRNRRRRQYSALTGKKAVAARGEAVGNRYSARSRPHPSARPMHWLARLACSTRAVRALASIAPRSR